MLLDLQIGLVAIVLHWTELHWTALHCTLFVKTVLPWTELHCTALHWQNFLECSALHFFTALFTALQCTYFARTALHWLAQLRCHARVAAQLQHRYLCSSHKDTAAFYLKMSCCKLYTQDMCDITRSVNDILLRHSLRLNTDVVARAWQILGSLVVGVKIIFQIVIFFWCACQETYKKKLNFFLQNQSSCGSALSTTLHCVKTIEEIELEFSSKNALLKSFWANEKIWNHAL